MKRGIARRDVLKGLGATGAASVVGCTPEVQPGRIDHVVLVMMENRSFDHYLGALSIEEGREVDGLLPGMSNPHPDGGVVEVFHSTEWCLDDPPHSWSASHRQFNDGAMDGFVREYAARTDDPSLVMGYHRREDLPVTYALADGYAVAERWFASLMTSTWPNRCYAIAGESQGMEHNDLDEVLAGGHFVIPTIFHRLDEAGIDWAAYVSNISTLWLWDDLRPREELKTLDHFVAHCAAGTLPALSWVEPAFGISDDHPPAHPLLGQIFLATIHEALARSPQWDRTLLVVYYDEHGGFHDHVPPPTAPDDRAAEGFDQLGFRVPAIVCGPWVKAGRAVRTVVDHTSVLAHLERAWGLPPLTTRTAGVNDLSSFLDEERIATGVPREPAATPTIALTEEEIALQCEDAARRSSGQDLLEALLDAFPAPPHLDRRHEPDAVLRDLLRHAVELGVVELRG